MKDLIYKNSKISLLDIPYIDEDTGLKCIPYIDEDTGLKCIIKVNMFGCLLGYAEYPSDIDINIDNINVHGGITGGTIDNINFIGFDCCHYDDIIPGMVFNNTNATYKDIDYVKKELKKLCKQIFEFLKDM